MAQTINKKDFKPEVGKKTKIETTYEYVPIIGDILGYWRKAYTQRLGTEVVVHLNHELEEYDRIIVNGKDITDLIKK